MPWFFRTLASWQALFARTGFTLRASHEPLHRETRQPMSIVFTLE
jgi:hypothetical protein